LINFGAFSVPFSGGSVCAYKPETADQELCARYFQLAVISPLAIMDTIEQEWMPYLFDQKPRDGVLHSLQQRFKFMSYMRAQIKSFTEYGGSMFTPLFALKSFTEDV
jgi:alpha-glucosidase (family GH31 glycosyl hydrolase)